MLTCSDAEVESLLGVEAVISAIRDAFSREISSLQMPARQHFQFENGTQLIMPCALDGETLWGVKFVGVSRELRAERRVNAFYLLLDSQSNQPVALLAANYLTELRTAATSAVATDFLARDDAKILSIFGTGRQATAHINVLRHVRKFEHVLVAGSSNDKSKVFARQMSERYAIPVCEVDGLTCARESDVICTCTTSDQPLFPASAVRDGTHLNLIGTFQPHAREVDSDLIRRARVFVDTYDGAFAEAGDILAPLRAGEIDREHVLGDLHELASAAKPGRRNEAEITIFKSVGCALADLVAARLVLKLLNQAKASA